MCWIHSHVRIRAIFYGIAYFSRNARAAAVYWKQCHLSIKEFTVLKAHRSELGRKREEGIKRWRSRWRRYEKKKKISPLVTTPLPLALQKRHPNLASATEGDFAYKQQPIKQRSFFTPYTSYVIHKWLKRHPVYESTYLVSNN